MKITVLFTLIQLFSIQKSVSQVIRYCYYVDGGTCTSDTPVNLRDSVLRPETSAKINLTCMSPQPIKWDLNIPVDKQIEHQRAELLYANDSVNESYYLEMNTDLKGLNGMIYCKSYEGNNVARVFIDTEKRLKFVGQQNAINFYVIERKDKFVVPCFAAGGDNLAVNLLSTSKENIVRDGVSESCIRCLCYECDRKYTSTNCDNCGPFFIGRQYWSDAGRMLPNEAVDNDDWRACANDYKCSVNTVRGYMNRHRKDCNGDGVITCEDLVSIHLGGPPCLGTSENDKDTIKDKQACINGIKSDTNITDMATFDPKVGFTVDGSVDINQYYVCTDASRKQQVTYAPLNSSNRIPANLYYELDTRSVSHKTISCATMWNVTLDLVFVDCLSLHHCATKLRPGLGLAMFAGAVNMKVEFRNLGLASYTPSSPEGMIGCVKIIESQTTGSPRYVREVAHYFTGLDSRIYIATNKLILKNDSTKTSNSIAANNSSVTDDANATSESIPINALVQLTHVTSNELTHGSQHSFRCRISTFVLLPNIQFGVTLNNGGKVDLRNGSNITHVLTEKVEIRRTVLASTALEQYLYIKVESNMKEISCSAPSISSKKRVTQTFGLDIEPDGSSWKIGLIVTSFVLLALVSVGVIFFVLFKYRDVKKRLRQLTEEEILAFHNGDCDSNFNSDLESIDVDKIGFPEKFKLSPNAFRVFQNEVLGEGEYGRCVKGEMEGQDVAVKMTKSQTDVEYFKAFLKEVKVMAYIDSHENIIEFMGAMVDRISERVCYVVLELSPYGDLLAHLRKNSDKFELNQGSEIHDNNTLLEMEIIRCVDLTNFCVQIASGMEHLSRKKMIHGDLAARNVLVFPNSRVKITDFGLSRKLYGSANYTKKKAVPLPWRWMAVESLKYLNFSTASDMWSFGVTMWEIFTLGLVPYPELSWSNDFIESLHNGLRLQKPAHASVELYDLMTRCWSHLPTDRPTFEEIKYLLRSIAQGEHSQYYLIVNQDQDDRDSGNELRE